MTTIFEQVSQWHGGMTKTMDEKGLILSLQKVKAGTCIGQAKPSVLQMNRRELYI